MLLCCIGAYGLNNSSSFDILVVAGFAVLGYLFHLFRCEPAPFTRLPDCNASATETVGATVCSPRCSIILLAIKISR